MVRISDILKQRGQFPEGKSPKDKKEEEFIPISSPEQPTKEEPVSNIENIEEKPSESMQFSKAMTEEGPDAEKEMQLVKAMHQRQFNPAESQSNYSRALEVIRGIFKKVQSKDAFLDLREAYEIVNDIVDRVVLGDRELVTLTINHSEENYLYAHSVNVCILSIDLGLGLGYNKSRLNTLGLGVLLHDVGMIKVIDIVKQPRLLTESEYAQVKKHPIYNTDILIKIKEIQEEMLYITQQVHERIDGKGYPKGLKGDQIHEYAGIAGIVDTYEALTHPRPHRKALMPNEALKELLVLSSSGLFEIRIIKIFVNRIGIYPMGSWVELNTGETGKVVLANIDSPLRPKVNMIFGPDKQKLYQIKPIDLSRHTTIYIKRSINPQD